MSNVPTAQHGHVAFNQDSLKALVRTVPDFPKPGILFYDVTTLLKDRKGFAELIDGLASHYIGRDIDVVLGVSSECRFCARAQTQEAAGGGHPRPL
jgi:adenine/guanine phosphoribosyltransferase-like PRPP-binding protein